MSIRPCIVSICGEVQARGPAGDSDVEYEQAQGLDADRRPEALKNYAPPGSKPGARSYDVGATRFLPPTGSRIDFGLRLWRAAV